MCQLSLTFFFPTIYGSWGWGWRSWRKRWRLFHTSSHMAASWETWMGNHWKILMRFLPWSSHHSPGHSDFRKTSHHSFQLSAFHPPVSVVQVQHFLRMFWKKILKNLGHQDHTQTEEMGSPQFLRWGGIFWAASWRVLFGGVKMIGDTWYVLNLVERHVEVGDLMAPYAWLNLRVLDTRKVRLLPN